MTTSRYLAVTAAALVLTACSNQPAGPADREPPREPSKPAAEPIQGAPGAGDPYYPQDGNGGYDVTGYRVAFDYNPADGMLHGDTTITARGSRPLSRFNLDLDGLRVHEVTVHGRAARFVQQGGELVITPAEPVHGEFRTRVRYGGRPGSLEPGSLGPSGWQRASSGGAYALGQPHSASAWYPVNDTPTDRARFELTARVPDGWQVVSGGVPAGAESRDGWSTFRWREPGRVISYLTMVGIDRWRIERDRLPDGTPIVNAYAPGAEAQRALQHRMPEILEFLSGKFGKYPQSAAGGIYLAEDIGFSLETQTRPTYTRSADLETVVHELAHQWYGDSVSLASWADICLNECVASYAQWLWSEAKEGKDLDAEYRANLAEYPAGDEFWARKLYDPGAGNEFDAVYDKGILAMHALRRAVGEQAFDRIMRDWAQRHRDGNASWPEFERFAQRVAGKDLRGFFDAWFRGVRRPADEHLYPGSLHP